MTDTLRETTGYINSMETMGGLDGPGMRTVVFFQGCAYRCQYCHNPETWEFGRGDRVTAGEVVDRIERYHAYFGRNGGATFSGGEPLLQPEFLRALLLLCRDKGIHTAVDTSGLADFARAEEAILAADMLLIDIKHMDSQECRRITGQGNEHAFALVEYCQQHGKRVWLRHVLCSQYDDKDTLRRLAEYANGFSCVERLQLLPLHNLAEEKHFYQHELLPPDPAFVAEANKIVEQYFKR